MIMIAFRIKRKNPRVKIVIGIVKIVKIGLTILFRKAKTTATRRALIKSLTSTPGSIHAVMRTATDEISIFSINFTALKLPFNCSKPLIFS